MKTAALLLLNLLVLGNAFVQNAEPAKPDNDRARDQENYAGYRVWVQKPGHKPDAG